ncbi:DUF2268 domain-containing putative Zn-dependent protease [Paracoccus sp. S1E-3]|uniref:DUF2268 domain-containing putative Zn-dependent protease n=1 Tax=Paracoccus sp. S1E-3 TaxID=2756130 RepID=UPI0015EE953E|nr:DUF2268 domain-containing putative Zn-dependent protease [Paracoccus sp. S1E-3]MBA4492371.1 peptidase [Paracoccus sp. S1E-3]
MSIFNIHYLNSRNNLTRVIPELRAAAREAVAAAEEHAALPRFDLVVRDGKDVMTGWGIGGCAPAPGQIQITLDPARFAPEPFIRTLVHELHHLIRWDGPGYGKTLGEALVSEGLAGHFVLQVLGGKPDPWDAVAPSDGLTRRAMNEWARLAYDHAEWFFGKGKVRRWSGYGLGHRLIAEYLSQHPDEDAATLANTPVDRFRAAMRKLANSDDTSDDTPEDTPAQDIPAEAAETKKED